MPDDEKVVLDGEDMRRTLVRIAHEVIERTSGSNLAIVGIHRRGAVLAARVEALVSELVGEPVPLGDIDISFYRDDLRMRDPADLTFTVSAESRLAAISNDELVRVELS